MKKVKSIKSISGIAKILTLLFLLPVFLLTGCGNGNGLKVGFGSGNNRAAIMVAVKSEKTEFDIDDVTLDFYYGGSDIGKYGGEAYERIGFAVYFFNGKYLKTIKNLEPVIEDYRAIPGFYFVKEISPEEYASGDYDVEIKGFSDVKFNHNETLTVPKETLELSKGYLCLTVMEIYYLPGGEVYCVHHTGHVGVRYEKINDRTVRLSKPGTITSYPDPS
ncbi:MAG: hypothetical protein LBS99_05885 [Clostridiales bacterium]|nr:hypothetical protein [Clostridiales bacterium]